MTNNKRGRNAKMVWPWMWWIWHQHVDSTRWTPSLNFTSTRLARGHALCPPFPSNPPRISITMISPAGRTTMDSLPFATTPLRFLASCRGTPSLINITSYPSPIVASLPPLRLKPFPSPSPSRSLLILPPRRTGCRSHGCLHDHSHHHHHDQHHHYHHHHHGHEGGGGELTRAQEVVLRFAKMVGWVNLANFLREHLQLCCCSMGLLLLAAACPYALPTRVVRASQNALIAVAFPLVGVLPFSSSLCLWFVFCSFCFYVSLFCDWMKIFSNIH